MLPKIIHYCWFGRGEKPALAKKCIASWRKFCPDFEIREWNEDNYEVYRNSYTAYCYENKKWAFLSDYVRLDVVEHFGGIYLDTDVELIRSLKPLLSFTAFYGFENTKYVATGLGFGAEVGHPTIIAMRNEYDTLSKNGTIQTIGCPILNTKALLSLGLVQDGKQQNVCGAEILPSTFLNPFEDSTGCLNITDDTFSIHWYAKSALSLKTRIRSRVTRPFHRLFGNDCFLRWKKNGNEED